MKTDRRPVDPRRKADGSPLHPEPVVEIERMGDEGGDPPTREGWYYRLSNATGGWTFGSPDSAGSAYIAASARAIGVRIKQYSQDQWVWTTFDEGGKSFIVSDRQRTPIAALTAAWEARGDAD